MPVAKRSRGGKSLRLRAFAKVNLSLSVLGRRPDGYHELRTIFQTISLHDTVELSITPGSAFEMFMTCNDPALLGPDNLVLRGIQAIAPEIGFRGSVSIHLEKKIPVARGLGGGSSDAAAALIGMLKLTGSAGDPESDAAVPGTAGAADGNRCGPGRGRAVFSVWRAGAGRESGRRNLSARRCAETNHRGRLATRCRRQHKRRLSVALCGIDKTIETQ